jgi:hypothetical protein
MNFRLVLIAFLMLGTTGCGSAPDGSLPEADPLAQTEVQTSDDAAAEADADADAPAQGIVSEVITLEPEREPEATKPPSLTDISTLAEFQTRFEAGAGKTRLVLLLSPT